MIGALSSLLALMLTLILPSGQAVKPSAFVSPCPNVFTYQSSGFESNKWHGNLHLKSDTTLYALWLDIVLDNKANILGNWVGEVSTEDNKNFKIENTQMTISSDQLLEIPFFVQYKEGDTPPKLKAIRFNGKEICEEEEPEVVEVAVPVTFEVTSSTTVSPTTAETTTSKTKLQSTIKTQYWYLTKESKTTKNSLFWTQTTPAPRTSTTLKPLYWTEAKTTQSTTLKPIQYWPPTSATLKPIYWTPAQSVVKEQTTTVRNPVWSFEKPDNKTKEPERLPETRTIATPRTTTELNLALNDQHWFYSQTTERNGVETSQTQLQDQNDLKTTSVNKYVIKTTVSPAAWPIVKVVENENSKGTIPSKTQFWPKLPGENITVAAEKPSETGSTSNGWSGNTQRLPDSGLQNPPYATISVKQPQSTQNLDQDKDTPLYVRPGDRQTISAVPYASNDNLGNRPLTNSGSETRQPARPVDPYPQPAAERQPDLGPIRPVKVPVENGGHQSWSPEKTSSLTGGVQQTWVHPALDGTQIQSGVDPSKYPANDGRKESIDGSNGYYDTHRVTTEYAVPTPFKIEESSTPKPEEYYVGGLPVFYIPNQGLEITAEPTCGKVLLNKEESRSLKSTSTLEGQWPWQVAIYQQQSSVNLRYICGGTLISNRHVITAAHCVTKKSSTKLVNKNTLTIYLGKHNLRNSVEGVQVKFVSKIRLYPEYNETNFNTDLAILELRDTVTFSERIQPACLWPEHETGLENIVGKTGSIVGWGYEMTGVPKEELTLLQLAVIDTEICIRSYEQLFKRFSSERTYCAGYMDSDTACNNDSGGGMVFQKGGSWYLRGVVSLSIARQGRYRCDPSHYVIFTDVAKFLPWIQGNIED